MILLDTLCCFTHGDLLNTYTKHDMEQNMTTKPQHIHLVLLGLFILPQKHFYMLIFGLHEHNR